MYLSKLKEHNDRKTPCVSVVVENTLQNPTKPYKTLLNPTKPYLIINTTNKRNNYIEEDNNGYYNCEYCSKKLRFNHYLI